MFFILSKILGFLSQPITWILILFTIAYLSKNTKRKRRWYISGIAGLLFFTNSVVFMEFTRLWETEGTKSEQVAYHDVAIVLGGMAEYDNNLKRLSIRRGGDRIWQTIRLYKQGRIGNLLICGDNGFLTDDGLKEAEQFKEVLIEFGIPKEHIFTDSKSKNTYQNAVEAKEIVDEHPEWNSFLLVTSALHMRRAKGCFEKMDFPSFDCFTTDHFTGSKRGYKWDQYIVPNFSVLEDWGKLTHEWVGYIVYDLVGYI